MLLNTDRSEPFVVEPGMRIAQLVVLPVAGARAERGRPSCRTASAARRASAARPTDAAASRASGSRPSSAGRTASCSAGTRSPGAASTGCCRAAASTAARAWSRRCGASWRRRSAIGDDLTFEGPVAVVDSIAPKRAFVGEARRSHHLRRRSVRALARARSPRPTRPSADTGSSTRPSSTSVVLHPPIQRFLGRWQPGDPAVYLGALWAP